MNYNYVKNSSFSIKDCIFIENYFIKFKNIKYDFHIMDKNNYIYFKIKNTISHIENYIDKNISISPNFCWNFLKKIKKEVLIMSVNPGFGNQFFLNKSIKKNIFLIKNIDGGINKKIYLKINLYFKKIIIGSKFFNNQNKLTFFKFNFIINEYN